MPPYRVNPPSRVNSLPLVGPQHDLSVLPPMAPIRASCDPCRKRKLRCTGAEPREGGARMCERCFTRGEVCIFSARKPMGRPRTVSSTPPSPSPCLSQPTTPPTPYHHHGMRMVSRGGKPHAPRHGFDTMYNQGAEHMEGSAMGFHHTPDTKMGWVTPVENEGGVWLPTPTMSTPSSSHAPMTASHPNGSSGPMLMAPSVSSDSFLGLGGEWSDDDNQRAGHGHGQGHGHHHPGHQRGVSLSNSDFLFEQSSATQVSRGQQPSQVGFGEASGFPHAPRCLCEAGRGIDDLRAQFRDVTSGAPAVEIALGAAHSVSNRCIASTTCTQCMSDQSTTIALVATIGLVTSIIQHAVPALQNMTAKSSSGAAIGSFAPSNGSSAASLAISAVESEIESLCRAATSVITNVRKATPANSPVEPSPFENVMFDQLQQSLADLGRRVSSLNAAAIEAASTPGHFVSMSWESGQPPQPTTPAWDMVVPLSAV